MFIDCYNKKNYWLSIKCLLLLVYLNKYGCFYSDNLCYNLFGKYIKRENKS